MKNVNENNELTSTLHLGLRSVVGASPESALASLLSSITGSEKAAIEAVINADQERAMVVVHRGANKGARFLIADQTCSIGRGPENDIFLDDVTVSRSHAVIDRLDGSFTLKDLGSLNGTYVNNQSLKSIELQSGDEIQIGKFHLIFVASKLKK